MINFEIEVEIDREVQTHVNLSIYKFIIEDTSNDS
jgi:hypothetical protein